MTEQTAAERERRAAILKADGEKRAAILKAEGLRQSMILESEGAEVCQRCKPDPGYGISAEKEKDQRADVPGGKLLL